LFEEDDSESEDEEFKQWKMSKKFLVVPGQAKVPVLYGKVKDPVVFG